MVWHRGRSLLRQSNQPTVSSWSRKWNEMFFILWIKCLTLRLFDGLFCLPSGPLVVGDGWDARGLACRSSHSSERPGRCHCQTSLRDDAKRQEMFYWENVRRWRKKSHALKPNSLSTATSPSAAARPAFSLFLSLLLNRVSFLLPAFSTIRVVWRDVYPNLSLIQRCRGERRVWLQRFRRCHQRHRLLLVVTSPSSFALIQ